MFTLEQIKEHRRKWVEVLRSGKYRQTKGRLKARNGSMCCIGVLTDLVGCDWRFDGGHYLAGDEEYEAIPTVAAWVGLASGYGKFGEGQRDSLTGKNDAGATFPEIADIIESNPPGLFLTDEEIQMMKEARP